ncbi:helix-turn-helix domain-containing protein [Numidum massiliense]|uniref:helix-turn-helix domain-containing protein n=1 Tax=Numidum massiliense TaxID=1522315 RepID=UPI0006D594F6|nr:helix-turn-helix transcriptional regulator [Numidum massiliense]
MNQYFDGSKLKRLRKEKGLTTQQIANKVNVSQSYISRFENNKAIPDVDMLSRVLEVLDTDISSFYSSNDELPPDLQELIRAAKKLTVEERQKFTELLNTILERLEKRNNE